MSEEGSGSITEEGGTPSLPAVRMWYALRIRDCGDRIGPNIVSQLSGRPTVFTADSNVPRLFTAGSILAGADRNAVVWGSGLMDPDQEPGHLATSNIHALRGKLTQSRLRDIGVPLPDVPLGDPGYLAPRLMAGTTEKTHRLGVIAHCADRQNPFVQALSWQDGVLDIDIRWTPEKLLQALSSCEAVVSSSLHGLVFAEALAIPNLWIKLSDRVTRSGFRFRDWFSMCARPQAEPYEPSVEDSPGALADRSALHDCEIDGKSLADSFPEDRLDELSVPKGRTFVSLAASRAKPLPIFVISFNRPDFLLQAIRSYEAMTRAVEIVVHDNGSDDAETIALLDAMRQAGRKVYHHPPITKPNDLNCVASSIADYFSTWSEPSRYVVSDCDIDLSVADASALNVYDELLDRYPEAGCIGPMLRIRDIPPSYPLYRMVMARHVDQFWHRQPEWTDIDGAPVATIEAPFDTTFALHRAGEPFSRLKPGRRVYHPYEARHLDWYLDPEDYRRSAYFSSSSGKISHWNTREAAELGKNERPSLGRIIYVDRDAQGNLVQRRLDLDESGLD